MEKEYIMTSEGLASLKSRLEEIKTVELPQVLEDIKVARAQGDLSENYEYTAAREHHEKLLAEQAEIEDKITYAKLIDEKKISSDSVSIGCTVDVLIADLEVPASDDSDNDFIPNNANAIKACGISCADLASAMRLNSRMDNQIKDNCAMLGFTRGEIDEALLKLSVKKDKKADKKAVDKEMLKHTKKYKIVGSHEANPLDESLPCISNESRVGKALLDRERGDAVIVGSIILKVVGINEKSK